MTSRLLLAGATGVLVASTAGAAALLEIQAVPVVAAQAPATPARPVVPTTPASPTPDPATDFDVDLDVDLDAILADVERTVEQAIDGAQIDEDVEAALAGVDLDGIVAEALQSVQGLMPGTPRLGVGIRDVTAEEATAAGLTGIAGAWVSDVRDDSPAAAAGLTSGDIIVRADGQDVRGARHLTRIIAETPAGRALPIEYQRNGSRMTTTVTPEPGPTALLPPRGLRAPRAFAYRMPAPRAVTPLIPRPRLGAEVQDLTTQLARFFGVDDGVLVTSVSDGSAAARAGLEAGDVIVQVDGAEVGSVRDLMRALTEAEAGSSIDLQVSRNRTSVTLSVTPDTAPTRNRVVVRSRGRSAAE